MEYLSCPSCGYFIGAKSLEFNKKKKEICDNNKLSDDDKSKKIATLISNLKLRRYCCRMRLFTCVDLSNDINKQNSLKKN